MADEAEDKKLFEVIETLSPRQAEFTLKMRDAINAIALQYSDISIPDWLLGTALEMYVLGGTNKEQVLCIFEEVWALLEGNLNSLDGLLAAVEARAGKNK
jgi:hypothetical protein